MEITPTTLLLVGVISAVLGFLANSLVNVLQEESTEPTAADDPVPPGGRKGHYTPIARLWRERSSGSLVVEIDGKSLVDATALDETQRARIEASARDLRAWLGMGLVTPVNAQPAGQAGAVPEGAGSVWATGGEALEADLRRALGRPAASQDAPAKPSEEGKTPAVGPKSIVLQIEDILQDMIVGTPLQKEGVHLSEDPARGVIVTVGGRQYEGIESVPDPAVKSAIRAAVAEWEQTQ